MNGKYFALQQDLQTSKSQTAQKKAVRFERRHFDFGVNIQLSFNEAFYGSTDPVAVSAQQSFYSFSYGNQGLIEPGRPVESFEAYEPANNALTAYSVPEQPRVEQASRFTDRSPAPVDPPPYQPLQESGALENNSQPALSDFEQDLMAILKGEKQYNEGSKTVNTAGSADSPGTSQPVTPGQPAPTANAHSIFDQMAASNKMAQVFDLGNVTLDRQFDEMDNLLEKSHKTKKPREEIVLPFVEKQLELNDLEQVEDLAFIDEQNQQLSVAHIMGDNKSQSTEEITDAIYEQPEIQENP